MTHRTLTRFSLAPLLLICAIMGSCAGPVGHGRVTGQAAPPAQPEQASTITAKPGWTFLRQAVAAANPLAAEVGLSVLRDGGSAVDAAVAVQMVLTLVEPQSSGIGGGAFLMHHDGQRVQAFDGRETAPSAANERLFLDDTGKPLPFAKAVVGGRSVGVPGTVAMLAMAHRQHGKLPWSRLLAPAIQLSERGFSVSPRLHTLLAADTSLKADPVAAAYFYSADGQPHPVGHVLKNPELAAVLRQIAVQGPAALSQGPVAQAMVDKVRQHPDNPGDMTLEDLARYQPREREPLCHVWRASQRDLRLCGFPPPSSGAITIGQILGLLARTPQGDSPLTNGLPGPAWLHSYTEASRLAFADRALNIADPDFVPAPAGRWTSLLAPAYLDQRARLITPARMPQAPAGRPAGAVSAWAPMLDQPEYGTSHISIADAFGNTLAMTTTIESGFGSRLMVSTDPGRSGGFLLNNELTDFSFTPADAQGRAVANRVEPGKRPRSSMSPTLVFDDTSGELLMSAGSPGGAFIIHFTAKTLLGTLQWGLSPQAAIDLPNVATTGGSLSLEEMRFPSATVQALQALGHTVNETALTSGLQALQRGTLNGRPVWLGGADPRREGIVAGD